MRLRKERLIALGQANFRGAAGRSKLIEQTLLLLIISTFNGNIKSTVMEMALIELSCSCYVNKMKKMPPFSLVSFITALQCNI